MDDKIHARYPISRQSQRPLCILSACTAGMDVTQGDGLVCNIPLFDKRPYSAALSSLDTRSLIKETMVYALAESESAPSTSTPEQKKESIGLLDLPYEIRLHIYHLVHVSSPAHHPQLAPWYPIPTCRTYIAQAVVLEGGANIAEANITECKTPEQHVQIRPRTTRLLSPHRSLCHIPTAFLQCCQQIYHETRCIPFQENEFVFINWFSSGLSSALSFTRGRKPWQREEMRFVRLEVFAKDIATETRFTDWVELCGFWAGLRGLRLLVRMDGEGAYQALGQYPKKGKLGDLWELVGEKTEWISQGLGLLGGLRQLEIELTDVKWTDQEKVRWCGRVQEVLVSSKEFEIDVTCVKKKQVPIKRPEE